MNYLKSLVTGEAASIIQGLLLSNENYDALQLLEQRFGDLQLLISSHMNNLLSFKPINSLNEVKLLSKFYDSVETEVRGLNSLGLEMENFGAMLIPVLMSKVPAELKLIMSRSFGKELWDVTVVLELIRTELEAREKISSQSDNKVSNYRFSNNDPPLACNYLRNSQWPKDKCVFCEFNHPAYKCKKGYRYSDSKKRF